MKLDDSVKDLLRKKVFVHMATLMRDGSPQVSPVWVDVDGDRILINSAQGRVKDKNVKRDPRVALSVSDPENPYKTIMIRGRVVDITTDGAEEHIDALAKKYLGVDEYPMKGKDVRVIYRIEADSVSKMG